MRKILAASAVLMTMMAVPAAAQPTAPTAAALPAGAIAVRDGGLVATWYPPRSGRRGPAILALGGSEGGERGAQRLGTALSGQGYGVLALAYFGADGLPLALQEIPLDYFDRAIAWLRRQPLVDPARVGIYGISVGGETALLVASRHPELRAVVAAVPSSVVWQGFDRSNYLSVKSTYAAGGAPVPFVPYAPGAFSSILDLYQRSMPAIATHADAVIPVERIGGSILLLSARDDRLWPSTIMADQVMARLDAYHFAFAHRHVAYADAGHGAMVPPDGRAPGDPALSGRDNMGGNAAGNDAARADMWHQVLSFLDETIGAPGR